VPAVNTCTSMPIQTPVSIPIHPSTPHTPLVRTQTTEAANAWRAGVISNALAVVRRNGGGGDLSSSSGNSSGSSPGAHRQALLTLGGYAPHLAPGDAVQVVRQALEIGGLGEVAFAALVELQRMEGGRAVLLREADGLVAAACKGGRVRMAVMVVEEVQKEHVHSRRRRRREEEAAAAAEAVPKPFISRASYLSLLRRLQQKGRPRSYWQLAESLVTHKGRPAAAVLEGDPEAVGLAMVVCWKGGNWRAVQRLLGACVRPCVRALECVCEKGGRGEE
jgi:hypothetical protein